MLYPKVVILMCTYNGERYLVEQLESIALQTYPNWMLYVSDDGSSDGTLGILKQFQERFAARVRICQGPQQGFSANFLSLVCNEAISGDYYAFSDQDDIWLPNKLARAVKYMEKAALDKPLLYCSRSVLVDEDGRQIALSAHFKKKPSFFNAIVQSLAGGNTMVLNHIALKRLRAAGLNIKIISHDWWAYLLVSGSGGEILYDAEPFIYYRQHHSNLIGGNRGYQACFSRLLWIFKGRFKTWINSNCTALLSVEHLLTPENRQLLHTFIAVRKQSSFISRLTGIKQLGIYRQTWLGNLGLIAAALLGKM